MTSGYTWDTARTCQDTAININILSHFVAEDKRKINAWVPTELYDRVLSAGYSTVTEAVIKGLEMVLQDTSRTSQDTLGHEQVITTLKADNSRLRATCDGMQEHIDTLQRDLQDLKDIHNNYMLQMQTLINQRAIEAPGAKRPWWKLW